MHGSAEEVVLVEVPSLYTADTQGASYRFGATLSPPGDFRNRSSIQKAMEAPPPQLLTELSRADLQALAKKHGVRANQKTEALIKELDDQLRFGLYNEEAAAAAAAAGEAMQVGMKRAAPAPAAGESLKS